VYAASALLISLQVAGTLAGFASWGEVRAACAAETELATRREMLSAVGASAREVYVHQAHTLIEGGAGHLDHLAETEAMLKLRLDQATQTSPPLEADLGRVAQTVSASARWFQTEVVPRAKAGALDQAAASQLHHDTEKWATEVDSQLRVALDALDTAQAQERQRMESATQRAWISLAVLSVGGALAGFFVARQLARSIVQPVEALRTSAAAFGEGRSVGPAPEGADELGELGAAFNRMVASVRAAEKRSVEAERLAALGQMSGAVAHELMNPLAVILGDPAMLDPSVAASRAEAEHARRVVTGLLGFARPGEEPAETVDLALAAQACAARMLPVADVREIEIQVNADPCVTTVASPSAVRQVLDNLVRNAIDASKAGSRVEIAVRAGPIVEVLDRGEGVPANVRDRLYEPFVTGRPEGTGLGLAVCQRIARAHGGAITHLDREQGGTTAVWTVGGGHA
jgi:signal transduction histidine kinase